MQWVNASELSARCDVLSEKEKQTLRLIVRGHDAKSMARQLNLSVHTVNERLRDARRKLEVSSSREAARLLFEAERVAPQNLADDQLGEAADRITMAQAATPTNGHRRITLVSVIAGAVIMSIILGLFALTMLSEAPAPTVATAGEAATAASTKSEAARSAREWLVLHDQRRWKETWQGTATSFQKLNSLERWTEVAEKVRPPLGAMISRTLLSQESVPAPPAGVEVIKFRTSFANKADVVETVSLAREGSAWKVVGIYID